MKFTEEKIMKIGMLVALVIVVSFIVTYLLMKGKSKDELEAFNNMFGGLNTLFSGFALAGIILTILLQKNELTLQRQELSETREELRRTAEAQEKAEKALNRQAENLKISAKLSAMSTLVNYYGEEAASSKGYIGIENGHSNSLTKRKEYILKIEEILRRKELN
ncbi:MULTISPECIES: hypothetical protein [unclassified Flavobacterium]|uniref:hypothetical protein n=1 Tax=unclassified Flavobacterium TaxID=196869 RepID=UPI001F13AF90|nr:MULTISPECIES: hypothetical protein [unclassified Flavobacterium]UMY64666.1 hypothetical protein MKO97_09090 [Flavobacterium sp. HJ-32-4]